MSLKNIIIIVSIILLIILNIGIVSYDGISYANKDITELDKENTKNIYIYNLVSECVTIVYLVWYSTRIHEIIPVFILTALLVINGILVILMITSYNKNKEKRLIKPLYFIQMIQNISNVIILSFLLVTQFRNNNRIGVQAIEII